MNSPRIRRDDPEAWTELACEYERRTAERTARILAERKEKQERAALAAEMQATARFLAHVYGGKGLL